MVTSGQATPFDAPFRAPGAAEPVIAAQLAPVAVAPTKPRLWTVFVALFIVIVAVFLLQIIAVVPLAIWYLQRGIEPEQLQSELLSTLSQPAVFMGVALLGQLPMGGAALIAAWLSPVPLRRRLGFVQSAWSGRETALVLLGTLVPFAVGISSAYALSEVIPPDPGVKKMYASLTVAWAGPFVLFIALAPAFNEEMLFRGYVQRRLLERFNPWTALLVTATIFGLFHVMPHAIVAAFPIGVWLGLMAWKSGSLWPGIACHALVNGLWNVRAVLVKFEILPQRPPLALLVILGIIGVMAFAASLRIMFGRRLGASRGSRLLEHAVT